ncbi:methionine/alanine import family NSS transporter small subunit [Sanguibacter sp. 4.1]|uniref:Methionine/alanine import family NSS transporter small subunit n=1 Tax=Sanguibacter biliveldensis TaxID=3030830 RepID=A0AAF0Z9C6_9MICO|nr:methionine/alanine import family NSS transporter small subunit [Sanguibacter sp. 4.1]WPF82528.1 methionine/alanine import family NSS transporter small subunit [Sanguibacter sp. 4.1]
MTPTAIVVLVLALTVVWGGLALAILNLRRAPVDPDDDEPETDQPLAGDGSGPAGSR